MQAERVTSFGDKRKLVRNTAEEPFAAIAHLDCHGTGFLSRIDDTFVVITAGHCLQKKELVITFGENSPTVQPSYAGKIRADKGTFGLPSNYAKCEDSDFGIILLENQNLFNEKSVYLPLEVESGQRPVMMSGYPGLAEPQHGVPGYPLRTQWSTEVTDCMTDGSFLRYRDATTGGNSGSPLFVKQNGNYVAVGIHIAGGEKFNTGIRITKEVINTLRSLVESVKRGLDRRHKDGKLLMARPSFPTALITECPSSPTEWNIARPSSSMEKRKQEIEKDKQEVKRTLMELADELDEHQRGIRIAKTSFASAGVVSAGIAIGGAVFALLTAGGSLALAVGGLVGGAVSGAGTLATNKAEDIINSMKLKAAQEAVRKITASYSHSTSVEGETGGLRAVTTGITTMLNLLPPVLIGLNIAEIVYNSIKIDKKSPSEVAEQIRSIARMLD